MSMFRLLFFNILLKNPPAGTKDIKMLKTSEGQDGRGRINVNAFPAP
jgi:hypothetical protein